jgi:hypothetical protein
MHASIELRLGSEESEPRLELDQGSRDAPSLAPQFRTAKSGQNRSSTAGVAGRTCIAQACDAETSRQLGLSKEIVVFTQDALGIADIAALTEGAVCIK